MARRKRTIKNKQKQDDELLVDLVQTREEAQDFLERNQNLLFGGLVALVVLFGGYLAYKNLYVKEKQTTALEQMWVAENQFAQDSFAVAISNPGGGNLGFADIADQYGVSDAANAAAYYTAVGYLNLGEYDAAIAYLNDVSASGQLLPILKNGLLGDAHSEKEEFDKALSFYNKAANSNENEVLTPYYLHKVGMLSEKQGNKSAANAAYARIKSEFPDSNYGREIEKYLMRTAS